MWHATMRRAFADVSCEWGPRGVVGIRWGILNICCEWVDSYISNFA